MIASPLDAWKDELAAELAEAERELAEALAAKAAAAAAHTAAVASHRAAQEMGATFRQPIPASLARRLDPTGADLRRAEGALTRTHLVAQGAEGKAADLRAGLAEVERLIAAADPEATEAEAVT